MSLPFHVGDGTTLPYDFLIEHPMMLRETLNLFRASELCGARICTYLAAAMPHAELRARALQQAEDEVRHARLFGERVATMGGVSHEPPMETVYVALCATASMGPPLERFEGPMRPLDVDEVVGITAAFETQEHRSLRTIREFLRVLPPEDPTRSVFERVLVDERAHAHGSGLGALLGEEVAARLETEMQRQADTEARLVWPRFIEAASRHIIERVWSAEVQ